MNKFLGSLVFLLLLTCTSTLAYAESMMLFPNQELTDLTLITTDPENGSFAIIDKSGKMQEGITGDLIGVQEAKVLEVNEIYIVTATYEEYDWYGTTRIRTNTQKIPKARILKGSKGIR